jgi:hypothetical protein
MQSVPILFNPLASSVLNRQREKGSSDENRILKGFTRITYALRAFEIHFHIRFCSLTRVASANLQRINLVQSNFQA